MQRIFNKDGFNWWVGVVEDRLDPEKMGRCRVRIFGYHSDSRELLPTEDLPWAVPILPITSAATSGIGTTPLGPVTGTWVVGFFLDGEDMQQPAFFGAISTKNLGKAFTTPEAPPPVTNKNDGILKDGSGNPVVDGSGTPVRAGTPDVPGWELGQSSEKYESGGKGPGVINDYKGAAKGDLGGASYGVYQFASFLPEVNEANGKNRPKFNGNSPVEQYIKSSKYKEMFAGLTPATPEFDNKWKEIASTDSANFKKSQHDYVKEKYYDVYMANLMRSGLDLSNFGPGVQDLVWSTAVQFGGGAVSIFTTPLDGKSQLTDKDIITLVSDYKINTVDDRFKSSSTSVRAGVKSRFENEKTTLLKLVKA